MRDLSIKTMPSSELEVTPSSSLSHPYLSCVDLNNLPSTPPIARMSPTNDQPTRDSGPRSSTSQIGAGRPERDHLPLILDNILRVTDEGEQLSQRLSSALSKRSIPEQHRIRFFAYSLYRNCNNLSEAGPSLVNQEIDVGCRQNHEQLDDGDVIFQDGAALGSAIEPESAVKPPASIKPVHIAENEEGDIALKGRVEIPGSDTQPCADNDDIKQSTLQRIDGRDPQPIHVEDVDERMGPTSDGSCTATLRPKTRVSDGTGAIVSGASASVAGTTLMANSPNVISTFEPMTPERTPSRGATPPRQTDDCEQGCLDLLD